jgi:hypothetical protein
MMARERSALLVLRARPDESKARQPSIEPVWFICYN